MTDKVNLEKIYKLIVKYLEAKLEFNFNMIRTVIPKIIRDQNTPKSYIFLSKDFFENKTLCVIIPDRGDNHPAVFNKSSLFYESLKKGSVFPHVGLAYKENYSILLMNPNNIKDPETGKNILEFNDHYSHCEYVWNEYITGKRYEHVVIIAHQLASLSVIKLVNKFSKSFVYLENDFMKFVKKIALINSIHNSFVDILDEETKSYFQRVAVNYIPSTEPEGTLLYSCLESDE